MRAYSRKSVILWGKHGRTHAHTHARTHAHTHAHTHTHTNTQTQVPSLNQIWLPFKHDYIYINRCWTTTRRTRILQQWLTCLTGTYFRSLIQTGTLTRGKAQWLVRVAYTWYDFKGGCKKHRNKHYIVDIYRIAINAWSSLQIDSMGKYTLCILYKTWSRVSETMTSFRKHQKYYYIQLSLTVNNTN